MTAVPFPLITAPGRQVNTSGGRLINVVLERLSDTAGQKYAYFRAPGLLAFGTAGNTKFRGALLVGTLVYAVFDTKVYTFPSAGGAGTQLTGSVNGTALVFMARDNAATPHIVIVSPGDGAFTVAAGAVSAYSDPNIGQPNAVTFLRGAFVFTYGDGTTKNSNTNSLTINSLSNATAESKPDTLYCPVPLGNGQVLLCGSNSIEVWGGQNDTGYLFNYIATIDRGLAGPYCICGHEDGFGKGRFVIGDDSGVHTLNGYSTVKISPDDLDDLIEAQVKVDRTALVISCFIARGHSYVAVQSPTWCWLYDVGLQCWVERQSYLQPYWRAVKPINAFGLWICGDSFGGKLLTIDGFAQDELGSPVRMRIETGPFGAFPSPLAVNSLELYLTKGVGIATGADPVQTDPDIEVSISRDGGKNWSNPRVLKVGRQSVMTGRVRSHLWGHADVQGVRWRFDCSSNVPFGFMGADMQADQLQ